MVQLLGYCVGRIDAVAQTMALLTSGKGSAAFVPPPTCCQGMMPRVSTLPLPCCTCTHIQQVLSGSCNVCPDQQHTLQCCLTYAWALMETTHFEAPGLGSTVSVAGNYKLAVHSSPPVCFSCQGLPAGPATLLPPSAQSGLCQ